MYLFCDISPRMQPVHVVVRIRPPFQKKISQQKNCVHIKGRQQLIVGEDKEIFTFDHAFGPDLTQKDVYDSCVQPLVSRFMEGSNSTVFAYGQTGSGKTFTMGTDTEGEWVVLHAFFT